MYCASVGDRRICCNVPEAKFDLSMGSSISHYQIVELYSFKDTHREKCSFVSFFSELTFGLLNPYCNSLVCLAVLILEIIPQKIAS